MAWLVNGEDSLPFKAHENGLDVWLGNYRGNIYSNKHIFYNSKHDSEFWDFDVTDHSMRDQPAMLSYIYTLRK